MSSTTYKKTKRGRSQSKASVETAVAKAMEEKKNKVPAKYADFDSAADYYQAWAGPVPDPYDSQVARFALLSQIARGNESYQRGAGAKKILVKGIQLRGMARAFFASADVNNPSALLTVVIVYDKDPVASTANILTDFLAANAGVNANEDSFNVALNNDGCAQRFQVLRRMDMTLTTAEPVLLIDTYIKGNKRPITYRNIGTGEIGDTQSGAIYAFVLQQSRWSWGAPAGTIASSPRVRVDLNFRVRFHEVI